MSAEYVIGIAFCCFGIGLTLGIMLPFIFLKLYIKMTEAFDIDIYDNDLYFDTVSK